MRDLIFYGITVTILFVTFWDGIIYFYETIIFVASYILYIFVVKNWAKWLKYKEEDELNLKSEIEDKISIELNAKQE